MVNFHSLGLWHQHRQGSVAETSLSSGIHTAAYLSYGEWSKNPHLRHFINTQLNTPNVADFFNLYHAIARDASQLTFSAVSSLLKLSHYDPHVLGTFLPYFNQYYGKFSIKEKKMTRQIFAKVSEHYYDIYQKSDLLSQLGSLFYTHHEYWLAQNYFERSLQSNPKKHATLHDLGLCSYYLQHYKDSVTYFERALQQDPACYDTREWLKKSRHTLKFQ